MQIHFKGTNYDLPASVSQLAKKKIDSLRKFVSKKEDAVQVYVELGKESGAHQSGRIWRAEINFDLEGERFRAVATEESIDTAIDTAVGELGTLLRHAQTKKRDLARKGGATIKSLLRGFGVR